MKPKVSKKLNKAVKKAFGNNSEIKLVGNKIEIELTISHKESR